MNHSSRPRFGQIPLIILGLSLGLANLPGKAAATSFIERPFPESVHDAPTIVRGVVGAGHADWVNVHSGAQNQRLYTFYDVKVSEVIKGDAQPGPTQFRVLGGEKDGVGMHVAGAPEFAPNEEVVVFLGTANSDGSHDLWGLMMGKFNLVHDADGSERLDGPGLGRDPSHKPGPKWTMAALRKVVADQGGKKQPPVITKSPVPSPRPSSAPPAPSPSPSPITLEAGPSETPAPPPTDDSSFPSGTQLLLGCVLGVLGILLVRWIWGSRRS